MKLSLQANRYVLDQILILTVSALGLIACTETKDTPREPPSFEHELLTSKVPMQGSYFGSSLAFSPDSNSIVIGAYLGDSKTVAQTGTVQIFNKVGGWQYDQFLTPPILAYETRYGSSVLYSPDGKTLAVGAAHVAQVYLYSLENSEWVLRQTLNGTSTSGFGGSLAISSDGTTLAIGSGRDDVNGIVEAGSVQIFEHDGINWFLSDSIYAKFPGSGNYFGATMMFSADGSTFAVTELRGDTSVAIDSGLVHLYLLEGNKWTNSQTLESTTPDRLHSFGGSGYSLAFSPDSSTLVVAESCLSGSCKSGKVHVYIKAGISWELKKLILGSGTSVSFRADGEMLAIGESNDGKLALYTKNNSEWTLFKNLSNVSSRIIIFSPIGTILATGSYQSPVNDLFSAGIVLVFDTQQF